MSDKPTQEQYIKLYKLIGISITCIFISGYISYKLHMKKNPKSDFLKWLNGKNFSIKTVLIGMVSGVVFGFIDNAGLWYGMDALEPFVVYYGLASPGSNAFAGWGNAFSDMIGSSMGTFIGSIIITATKTDDSPIWADIVGVVIGCILGIYIPKALSGDK